MRGEIATAVETLRGEIAAGDHALEVNLRTEIRAGDEETRLQMRVLHEDLVGRLALLQEGMSGTGSPAAKPGLGSAGIPGTGAGGCHALTQNCAYRMRQTLPVCLRCRWNLTTTPPLNVRTSLMITSRHPSWSGV